MDFSYTPEQEKFRGEVRRFLEKTSAEVFGPSIDALATCSENLIFGSDERHWKMMLEYHRRLLDAGYLALHWPKEWGGAGAGLVEQAIYQDEVMRLGLPLFGANHLAIDRIGPTLMLFGADWQKKRFIPKMLTAEEIWCQGYSEPNAGSDLAGLQTRAVLDGDHFVINGQKVWTSLAHRANFQVLLVRTDPAAPKHKGISYLLVDMKTPGITVRPLVKITGHAGFNEVFYDNVVVPRENLVGELNKGWEVSVAMLMFQRVSAGTRQPIERTVKQLFELSKAIQFDGVPAHTHPYVRQTLVKFASEARCVSLGRYRALSSHLKGKAPGPEGSFAKLFTSELNLRVTMFAAEMLGAYAAIENDPLNGANRDLWVRRLLNAREYTIAGGTSEIQHNIIGERVLRLPKG
jgi:alkylation response protein AidB-like acyl-CoA dehydrogenase